MNPTVSRFVIGGTATAAAIVARRAAEVGWQRYRGTEPPTAEGLSDDTDLRDLLLWSALLIGAVAAARKVAAAATRRLVG